MNAIFKGIVLAAAFVMMATTKLEANFMTTIGDWGSTAIKDNGYTFTRGDTSLDASDTVIFFNKAGVETISVINYQGIESANLHYTVDYALGVVGSVGAQFSNEGPASLDKTFTDSNGVKTVLHATTMPIIKNLTEKASHLNVDVVLTVGADSSVLSFGDSYHTVPEPSSLCLLGLGGIAVAIQLTRQRKALSN